MDNTYDLVVVGGGINGSALARLSAYQGLKVLLLESSDFGAETSSASSKLIHGGIRYLEYFDFPLVRESLLEREDLLLTAPHLVSSWPFYFPINQANRHNALGVGLGLRLYDLLSGRFKASYKWLPRKKLIEKEPAFKTQAGKGAFRYNDCIVDDARLVLENVLDAARMGARVLNYHHFNSVEETEYSGEKVLEVSVLSKLEGVEKEFTCRNLAFCLGPWNDTVISKEFKGTIPQLRRSQGIHLFVRRLPLNSCFILPVPGSNRYVFILPWRGGHLLGTTETDIALSDEGPFLPREGEIKELHQIFKYYFPNIELNVICTICGVRPLAANKSKSTVSASRRHKIHKVHPHVYTGVGGKYTTHRVFAEDFYKEIYGSKLKYESLKSKSFPGAWSVSREQTAHALARFEFVDNLIMDRWLDVYGQRSLELANFIQAKPENKEFISSTYGLMKGEVKYCIEREWARLPVDFLRRRTGLYYTESGGFDVYQEVKEVFNKLVPHMNSLEDECTYTQYLQNFCHRAVDAE